MTQRRKNCLIMAVFLLILLFPMQAFAYIDATYMGKAAEDPKKPNETFNYREFWLQDYWDVVNAHDPGNPLGGTATLEKFDITGDLQTGEPIFTHQGWYNFVDIDLLEEWVEAFNGNLDFME